jgi:hypothetical protein
MHTPPILLPDVHTFGELLTYCGEWDHETMSHRGGVLPPDSPRPAPRYIAADGDGARWLRGIADVAGLPADPPGARNEIGPFCTVDLSQLGGPRHRGIAVRATDAVLEAVAPRIVTPDDHLSFSIIGHAHTGRALVVLQHGYISGSHWLAEIDPASIPAYPYAARDARKAEICRAIRESNPAGYHVPYLRDLPGGTVEISCRTIPGIRATIHADGSMERTWSDGTVSREAAPTA